MIECELWVANLHKGGAWACVPAGARKSTGLIALAWPANVGATRHVMRSGSFRNHESILHRNSIASFSSFVLIG
jgi:hypothetical protein